MMFSARTGSEYTYCCVAYAYTLSRSRRSHVQLRLADL